MFQMEERWWAEEVKPDWSGKMRRNGSLGFIAWGFFVILSRITASPFSFSKTSATPIPPRVQPALSPTPPLSLPYIYLSSPSVLAGAHNPTVFPSVSSTSWIQPEVPSANLSPRGLPPASLIVCGEMERSVFFSGFGGISASLFGGKAGGEWEEWKLRQGG